MPRKRKKESSGERRKRQRAAKARDSTLEIRFQGPNHLRIEVDSLELACMFTIEGGMRVIGNGIVHAFDVEGRDIANLYGYRFRGAPVVDNLLQIGRDKAAKLMARANDAALIRQIRKNEREDRKSSQVDAILAAEQRHANVWLRQDVPDQSMRSILTGTNARGVCPTEDSDGQVVCDKTEDGRFRITREWTRGWEQDSDEDWTRVVLNQEVLADGFVTEHAAQSSFKLLSSTGALDERDNRPNHAYLNNRARRLRSWGRASEGHDPNGKVIGRDGKMKVIDCESLDMKEAFGTVKKAPKPKVKAKRTRLDESEVQKLTG